MLSVNISGKQFHHTDFVAQVEASLLRHAIKPKQIKLELTEGVILQNIDNTLIVMNALNKIGISFALDNFGTGYSSLQYLQQLPINQIKIDQSFVHRISASEKNSAIVRTIISMANSLDFQVIAEGVKTKEQHQLLYQYGCTQYQGFLLGMPLTSTQFETSLAQLYHPPSNDTTT